MFRSHVPVALVAWLALGSARVAAEDQKSAPGRDRYGDPLPKGAVARLGTLRWRHILRDGSGFATLTLSPDGKQVASQGDVGLRVWDAATGKPLDWLRPTPSVKAAVFTPDGKMLLTATNPPDPRATPSQARWLIQHWEEGSGKV